MIKKTFLISFYSLGLILCQIEAQKSSQDNPVDIETRIQRIETGLIPHPGIAIKGQVPHKANLAARMKAYRIPGVSIAAINEYEIEWSKGYGVREAGGSDPVDLETLFQAASISKPLAAAAALSYVERGLLNLDADVNGWLRSWKVPENQWTRKGKVTLRALLSHTAGVTVEGFPGYAEGKDIPTLGQVLDGEKPANSAAIRVDSEIGTKFRYSGGGYAILQQLLIDALHKPFPEIMRRAALEKLRMANSTYEQPLPQSLTPQAASGHHPDGTAIRGRWHIYPEMAAAGLWTTPSDLAGFAIALMLSKKGQSEALLSQAITELMLTPVKEGIGLGLFVKGNGQDLEFFHGGSNEGYRCAMTAFPERGQGAVIMTNGDLGGDLILEIFRSISAEYGWPDYRPVEKKTASVDKRRLETIVGTYQFTPTERIIISLENDRLFADPVYIHPEGKGKCEFFPESETAFFSTQTDVTLVFSKNKQGGVTGLTLKRGQTQRKATKSSPQKKR